MRLAIPMTLAQLMNVLYNVVDRMFIGRIGGDSMDALTGVGVCLPMITIVIAFANLVGMGVHGVFIAEPISNAVGGLACFITMLVTVYCRLGKEEK